MAALSPEEAAHLRHVLRNARRRPVRNRTMVANGMNKFIDAQRKELHELINKHAKTHTNKEIADAMGCTEQVVSRWKHIKNA